MLETDKHRPIAFPAGVRRANHLTGSLVAQQSRDGLERVLIGSFLLACGQNDSVCFSEKQGPSADHPEDNSTQVLPPPNPPIQESEEQRGGVPGPEDDFLSARCQRDVLSTDGEVRRWTGPWRRSRGGGRVRWRGGGDGGK